ncbi:MAG: hypothetical protein ACXWCG_00175 [Flavitalea sp.]
MNEHQPYEKHLADKLHQLPLPDVEPNWQQMKFLLDKEMPRGGGYWRWITGIGLLLLMLGGTWYFTSSSANEKITTAVAAEPTGNHEKDNVKSTSTTPGSQPGSKSSEGITSSQKISAQITDSIKKTNEEILLEKLKTEKRLSTRSPTSTNPEAPNGSKLSQTPALTDEAVIAVNSSVQIRGNKSNKNVSPNQPIGNSTISHSPPGNMSKNVDYDPGKYAIVFFPTDNGRIEPNIPGMVVDSLNKNYSRIFPANKPTASSATAKAKSAKAKNLAAGENKNLAFGFSLPMTFPLGDQKPGPYNVNAKPNTVTDYIPVPHLQYHVNNKVYLQTEIQLMKPQFIQPVLMYQHRTEYPSTNSIHYNSIYARKLYYFNIPVGIHYSPFQHFYLGTGLQFSSLVSGVAMREETSFVIGSGIRTVVNQSYEKFKNDTISDMIDNSEFRLMLDANYYWKQFTVGLRYNQALSNYVSFRLNNVSPLFQDKNKSLQFYLRYNLWEDRKKR